VRAALVACGALLGGPFLSAAVATAAGDAGPVAGLVPAASVAALAGIRGDSLPGDDADAPAARSPGRLVHRTVHRTASRTASPTAAQPAGQSSWAASVPPAGVLVEWPADGGSADRFPTPGIVLVSGEEDGAAAPGAAAVPAKLEIEAVSQASAGQRGAAAREGRDAGKQPAKNPCADQAGECREALQQLRDDDIAGIGLDIRVGGRPGSDYPCECRLEGETYKPRRFATTTFTWKAAGYCHKPLYFEDWSLERYGHSHGYLDPVFSGAHFFVTLTVLPYKMGVELPWECVYPLGHYRPGDCAPWTVPAVPISCRGFAAQAATVTGLVFLLP